ncbi:MAG: hypothetical protein KGL95_06120 [Patescibacteria group bacterium]|nr:hypothetical protein [Patescibacteria group bacterium]
MIIDTLIDFSYDKTIERMNAIEGAPRNSVYQTILVEKGNYRSYLLVYIHYYLGCFEFQEDKKDESCQAKDPECRSMDSRSDKADVREHNSGIVIIVIHPFVNNGVIDKINTVFFGNFSCRV